MISQKEYDEFYNDIMEYVRGTRMPEYSHVWYCRRPNPLFFIKAKIENSVNQLLKSNISLSEREYGRFIDEQYKSTFIRTKIYYDEHEMGLLKMQIAFRIKMLKNAEKTDIEKKNT